MVDRRHHVTVADQLLDQARVLNRGVAIPGRDDHHRIASVARNDRRRCQRVPLDDAQQEGFGAHLLAEGLQVGPIGRRGGVGGFLSRIPKVDPRLAMVGLVLGPRLRPRIISPKERNSPDRQFSGRRGQLAVARGSRRRC